MPGPKTILIIEDHLKNLKLCRDLLEYRGHTVLEANDGLDGINIARIHKPDLILMDIQLPQMDGIKAAAILREKTETKDIPIIAFTAFAMKGDEERFLESGFNGYMAKPIDTRRFAKQVESFFLADKEEKEWD